MSAEHKAEVRRRLLDAARRVLLRDGAEQVTTRAIVDEAGLSAGALYTYFASKEELLGELATGTVEANAAAAWTGPPPAGAAPLVRRLVEGALTRPVPESVMAYLRSRTTPEPAVQEANAALNAWVVERFRPLVEAGQREGAVAPGVDAAAAVELMDLVSDGMNLRAATGTFATSFERVGAAALGLLWAPTGERVP